MKQAGVCVAFQGNRSPLMVERSDTRRVTSQVAKGWVSQALNPSHGLGFGVGGLLYFLDAGVDVVQSSNDEIEKGHFGFFGLG